ncbi:MAG TPA: HD-GYP domain-containing protein [bacterium]|nr:HD-GYP domain-containing protein [bacterium]
MKKQSGKRVKNLVDTLYNVITELSVKNHEQFHDLVKVVLKALREKDQYTQEHSIRVVEYAIKIGEQLGLDKEQLRELELAAVLHDIGKIGIPDRILKKPGRLTKEEYAIMQEHSTRGEDMLKGIENLDVYKKYVRTHHERFDGFGYPDGLKEENIPLISRIIFVADTFDAMTSDRPYRKGMPIDVAVDEIIRCSGTQFDPKVVNAFIKIIKKEEQEKQKRSA